MIFQRELCERVETGRVTSVRKSKFLALTLSNVVASVTRALQTLATIESETRELILAEAPSQRLTETDAEIVPLIEKIGA